MNTTFTPSLENISLSNGSVMGPGYIMQVIFSLAIVIGFAYITLKYVLPKLKTSSIGRYIKVIDRVFLEPQVTAYMLEAKGKSYLVVISQKKATLLDKYEN